MSGLSRLVSGTARPRPSLGSADFSTASFGGDCGQSSPPREATPVGEA